MLRSSQLFNFSEIDSELVSQVGNKGVSLGEMARAGFMVPLGFIVGSHSYREFIKINDLENKISTIFELLSLKNPESLQESSFQIRRLFKKAVFPDSVEIEIKKKYKKMGSLFQNAQVAVRSSGIGEGVRGSSLTGQQESFLNISGESEVLSAVRDCWSSVFTPQAILYREENNIDHFRATTAVIIQSMIQATVSGTAFTTDPILENKQQMIIEAVWGLGEQLVRGSTTPDIYTIDRHTLEIINIEVQEQDKELLRKGKVNLEVKVPTSRKTKQKLNNIEIKKLSKILQKIHSHYYFPQNIEWALSHGEFYILEARPLTALPQNINSKINDSDNSQLKISKILITGSGASAGIVTGVVRIVKSVRDLAKVKKGDILVTNSITPVFISTIKYVGAIITERGGVTSHAAIIARELGLPCIVGANDAMKILSDGTVVTVNAKDGIVCKGARNAGGVQNSTLTINTKPEIVREDIQTATKIYLNLSDPDKAKEASSLPIDGIGLLRAEFMIANIGTHPKHMLKNGRHKVFVDKLTESLEEFCSNFEPRPVIYRFSDFKTNEYQNLEGGRAFEPKEDNPLLGYRGAMRHIHDPEVFELELAAIKKVREKYKNLWVMVPFVRSPEELLQIKRIMAASGLMRSTTFKLWMMAELPVNVILIEDFIKVGIDGVSIGLNDLNMLIHGIDRDNDEVSVAFNELSPAVLLSIGKVIKACRKYKIPSSICGEAISQYDSLVEEVVRCGITSISVDQNAIGRTQKMIYKTERSLIKD